MKKTTVLATPSFPLLLPITRLTMVWAFDSPNPRHFPTYPVTRISHDRSARSHFSPSDMHKPVDHTASPLMSSAVYFSSGGEEAPISRYHVIGSASQVRPWYLMPLSAFCNFLPQASSSSLILVSLKQECFTTHNRALLALSLGGALLGEHDSNQPLHCPYKTTAVEAIVE